MGFLGYFGYELLSDSLVGHRLPCRGLSEEHGVPDAELSFANCVLTFDHRARTWSAAALVRMPQSDESLDLLLGTPLGLTEDQYEDWRTRLDESMASFTSVNPPAPASFKIENSPSTPAGPDPPHLVPSLTPSSNLPRCVVSEQDYLESIDQAQREILAGESYELCLTTQFSCNLPVKTDTPPGSLKMRGYYEKYVKLRERNAAPYAAYVHFPVHDTTLLCSSPERFMRVSSGGWVDMKPIKGTARRVKGDAKADAEAAERLRTDVKERAENLMITDLIRHDLALACEPSTVHVARLIEIETAATVHSLVSTVVGKLRPSLSALDALAATFPPGSMTGAPKLSSVEILDRLERQRPRGAYSGILGFLALDGSAHFNVVIRTAVIRGRGQFIALATLASL